MTGLVGWQWAKMILSTLSNARKSIVYNNKNLYYYSTAHLADAQCKLSVAANVGIVKRGKNK